jgi:hypothetical protein
MYRLWPAQHIDQQRLLGARVDRQPFWRMGRPVPGPACLHPLVVSRGWLLVGRSDKSVAFRRDLKGTVTIALCPGGFVISERLLGDQAALDQPLEHEPARASPNGGPLGQGQDRAIRTIGGARQDQALESGEAGNGQAPRGVLRCGDRSAPTAPSPAGTPVGARDGPELSPSKCTPNNACPAEEVQQKGTAATAP